MAKHVQGIAITIKAFLPTGSTIDEQFAALSVVKEAHASGDYSKVLAAAKIDEVKSEQKTRRIEDEPAATTQTQDGANAHGIGPDTDGGANPDYQPENEQSDESVPEFLKKGKGKSAAA